MHWVMYCTALSKPLTRAERIAKLSETKRLDPAKGQALGLPKTRVK